MDFWSKVEKTDGCWLWTAAKTGSGGYGVIRSGDRLLRAHRVAYESIVGPIPDGFQIDHLCRVHHCVNPQHLEAVTQAENIRRGVGGKSQAAAKRAETHCKRGHPFSGGNLRIRANGRRTCRACHNLNQNRRRAAH